MAETLGRLELPAAVLGANGVFESGNTNATHTFVFKSGVGLAIIDNFDAKSSSHDVIELDRSLFRQADTHASPQAVLDLIQHHSVQLGPRCTHLHRYIRIDRSAKACTL
jgi:hypothetical protein